MILKVFIFREIGVSFNRNKNKIISVDERRWLIYFFFIILVLYERASDAVKK